MRKGSLLEYKKLSHIFSYMGPNNLDKLAIQGMAKEAFYGIDQLKKDYGLWQEAWLSAGFILSTLPCK